MTIRRLNPTTVIAVLAIILVVVYLTAHVAADNHPGYYANCTEAKAHHDTNIPRSSSFYRPALDRDGNGIACQT